MVCEHLYITLLWKGFPQDFGNWLQVCSHSVTTVLVKLGTSVGPGFHLIGCQRDKRHHMQQLWGTSHVIDWEGVKVFDQESMEGWRKIKEAIHTQHQSQSLKRKGLPQTFFPNVPSPFNQVTDWWVDLRLRLLCQTSVTSQVLPHRTGKNFNLWIWLCERKHCHVEIGKGLPKTVVTKLDFVRFLDIVCSMTRKCKKSDEKNCSC